jgi:glucose/arabinose dehydrogenase
MTARITLVTALLLHSTVWAATPLTTQRVATGLSSPLAVVAPPGDTERVFIVEQNSATIKIMDVSTGVINATPFLVVSDVRSSGFEQGLLGLAFHPNYASNRQFFVNYTSNSLGGDTVIARYTVSADPDIANNDKDVILIIDQFASNHNGGWIGFSPIDEYLYIATGDGGSFCDPGEKAQNINLLQGKMLRIDVDGDDFPLDGNKDYAIPPDNPFASGAGADEVFDYGLRNPYRCGFDRLTGDLYIGDVGQDRREEVSFHAGGAPGGLNFGWDCMEGTDCSSLSPSSCFTTGCTCNSPLLTLPIHDYNQQGTSRQAVTGGHVYRGCAIPDLRGTYFFADYASAEIWSLRYDGVNPPTVTDRTAELAPPSGQGAINWISSFGEDGNGEIYICDLFGGEVFKIVPDGAVDAPTPHDYDNDGSVALYDLARFDKCLTGPVDTFGDCLCDVFDTDAATGTARVDLRDFADFMAEFGN